MFVKRLTRTVFKERPLDEIESTILTGETSIDGMVLIRFTTKTPWTQIDGSTLTFVRHIKNDVVKVQRVVGGFNIYINGVYIETYKNGITSAKSKASTTWKKLYDSFLVWHLEKYIVES